jgi:hypothetical protein
MTTADHIRTLERRGTLTILEHTGGKTQVAIQAYGGIVTLEGKEGKASKEELLAELCKLTQRWPDKR